MQNFYRLNVIIWGINIMQRVHDMQLRAGSTDGEICFCFGSITNSFFHHRAYPTDFGLHAAGSVLTLDFDFDLLLPCNKVDTLVSLNNSSLLHEEVTTDTVGATKRPVEGAV